MIALWYRNGDTYGKLEPASVQDWRRRVQRIAFPPIMAEAMLRLETSRAHVWVEVAHRIEKSEAVFQPWTRRIRRRIARYGSGPGRRHARRISSGRIEKRVIAEALLYLPDGESVEQRHCDDVERWLAARGMA
jgi:hypothetical protein